MRLAPVLLVLAACAHGPKHTAGEEYLKTINVEGNNKLKSQTLVAGLALKRTQDRGRPPDPYLVQVDADRIRGLYLRQGFLAVDVRPRVERDGDATTVTYTVEEGLRAKTKVVINGIPEDPDLPISKIREQLPLKDGEPFDYIKYDFAKPVLINVVKDAGYAHAKLDAVVYADRSTYEAIVQLNYTTGPKCKFGKIEITGAHGDLAEAVQDRVAFATGDPYSTSAIAKTQRALYGLNRFSTVQIQPDETAGRDPNNPVVAMKVAVTEGSRHEVKLGGGFGADPTAYEVRGRAGYSIAGWPFDLDTVTLDFRPAYAMMRDNSGYEPRIRALARLDRDDLLWTYSKGSVEVGYNYLAVEAYTSYGPHTRLGFTTPLGMQAVQLRLGWGLESLDFRNISPLIDPVLATGLGIDRNERVGQYDAAVALDLRDNQLEPRLGAYAEVRGTIGSRYAAGNYEFQELVPELRGYVPVGDVVLAARGRFGAIWGDVPPTERFFSGGATSQRGFGERRLAPFVAGDVNGTFRVVPYGGAALAETSLEARIPITNYGRDPEDPTKRGIDIGAVVFLDGGDVTESLGELSLTNMHWAIGAGLRALTIVGPVRVDFGYRLNRKGPMDPSPDSTWAFHLSLGEAF